MARHQEFEDYLIRGRRRASPPERRGDSPAPERGATVTRGAPCSSSNGGASLSLFLLLAVRRPGGARRSLGLSGSGTARRGRRDAGRRAGGAPQERRAGGVAGAAGKEATSGTGWRPGTAGLEGGRPDGGPRDSLRRSTRRLGCSHRCSHLRGELRALSDPAHTSCPRRRPTSRGLSRLKGSVRRAGEQGGFRACGAGPLVRPAGDPSKSDLYAKVTQDAPCEGKRICPPRHDPTQRPCPADRSR